MGNYTWIRIWSSTLGDLQQQPKSSSKLTSLALSPWTNNVLNSLASLKTRLASTWKTAFVRFNSNTCKDQDRDKEKIQQDLVRTWAE